MYRGIFRPFKPQPFYLLKSPFQRHSSSCCMRVYLHALGEGIEEHTFVPSSNHVQNMLITFSHFTMFHWHIHIEDLCLNLGLVLSPGQYLCSPTGDAHDDASLKPVPGSAEECSRNRAQHGQRQFKTRTKPGEIPYYPYHPLLTLHKKNHGEVGWGPESSIIWNCEYLTETVKPFFLAYSCVSNLRKLPSLSVFDKSPFCSCKKVWTCGIFSPLRTKCLEPHHHFDGRCAAHFLKAPATMCHPGNVPSKIAGFALPHLDITKDGWLPSFKPLGLMFKTLPKRTT